MSRNGPGRDRTPFGALGSLGKLLETIRRAAEDGSLPDRRTDLGRVARSGRARGTPARPGQPRSGPGEDTDDPAAPLDRPTHVTPDGADRLVTVDLGDVGVDTTADLGVAVEDGVLTVGVDGVTVARTALPEGPWTVGTVGLNNGVFEARISPD